MRIAVGGFYHETNWLGNVLVTKEMAQKCSCQGETWFRLNTGVHSYSGGFIDEAKELGVEIAHAFTTHISPCGPITQEALEFSRDNLISRLRQLYQEEPFEGIALLLHGAARAEVYTDAESEILGAIRREFGPDMPVGAVLDLHGNVTEDMIALSDLLIGVKGYPHVDEYDRARDMFRTLCHMIQTGTRPSKKIIRLPWLITPAQGVTTSGPAHAVQQLLLAREQEDPDLLYATFFHGFPYADFPKAGVSIVTMANTTEAAEKNAQLIAQYAWEHRADFAVPLNSAQEAVDQALAQGQFPVIIHEGSDNPGGGTPGDGTHLLRELLRRDLPGTAFGFIYDPEVVGQAMAAGIGGHISCRLGGKTDKYHGEPIEIADAYVKCLSDGIFIKHAPMGAGSVSNLGMSACLRVGNVYIVVCSVRTQTMDDGPFKIGGLDWTDMRILALKSSHHFKGWWADKVKAIVPCDSPGIHCSNLRLLPLQGICTDYYPLADATWNE